MSFDWLTARPIAHRGWHGGGVVENTLGAAKAAIAAGYSIECDIRFTADGEAVVFHDATLDRLTQASGAVGETSLPALRAARFRGCDEPIPTLAELLSLIDGRTPLVCEIKSSFDGDLRLAARAAAIARDYQGPLAFKSFDPEIIAWLRAVKCPRPLGIVAEASYDDPYFAAMSPQIKSDCETFRHIGRTQPDFLSWAVDDLPHVAPTLFRALGRKPVMAWTVRRLEQWARVRAFADQAVFEGEAGPSLPI